MNAIHITQGFGKMIGISSINTPTSTNPFCKSMQKTSSICKSCYAQRGESYRKGLVGAFSRNLFLTQRPLEEGEIPAIDANIFRFHSYGEIHNAQHLENYMTIAATNPHTIFTLWTKRKGIVQRVLKKGGKPDNMILIYSSPVVDKQVKLPKGFDKVFTVYSKDNAQDTAINCHGSCNTCRLCYSHNDTTYINEIIK